MSAASRTIDIPELLESILLQLPLRDLLRLQRVNKTFRHAIKASTRLQQKLFFKSDPPKDGSSIINLFLERILSLLIQEAQLFTSKKIPDGILVDVIMCIKPRAWNFLNELHYLEEDLRVEINGHCHTSLSQVPSGSWKEMLVADPPRAFDLSYISKTSSRADLITPQNANELLEAIDKRT